VVSVTPDATYRQMFETYGDDNTKLDDWTGADGAYSAPLPDGRVAWTFSDTFLGYVNADGSRPPGQPLINNDLVIQEGAGLTQTLHGGTAQNPTALVTPTDGSTWYWMGAAVVEGDRLRVFLPKFLRTGPGAWDWEWTGTDIGSWALPGLTSAGISAAPSENGVGYGAGVLSDPGFTYVYGVEDLPTRNHLHVARVPDGGLLGSWEFYTGSGWSSDPLDSARTLEGIGTSLGVVRVGRLYVLFSFDGAPFSPKIMLYTSCTPYGPWGHRTTVYTTPETAGDTFTYNVKVHPHATNAAGILLSYDVNSFRFQDLLDDASLYRPRYIRVRLRS
jgi:hypothetical protein